MKTKTENKANQKTVLIHEESLGKAKEKQSGIHRWTEERG
jgi:hypothetical protein